MAIGKQAAAAVRYLLEFDPLPPILLPAVPRPWLDTLWTPRQTSLLPADLLVERRAVSWTVEPNARRQYNRAGGGGGPTDQPGGRVDIAVTWLKRFQIWS